MNYYLTDSVFINNGETFYENNKIKKITKNNWHNYLDDYGWCKLVLGWKKRLKEGNKNSCFGILECGSDGDCLFHVLCEALNSEYILKLRLPKYNVKMLRNMVANEINKDNYELILETYKLDYDENQFNFSGEWNPHLIKSMTQFKKELVKGGHNFWGDHILLQLLQKKMKINIIILNSDNNKDTNNINERFTIHPLASLDLDENEKTIIIYYLDQYHFQLVGYFDGNIMKTLFYKDELPSIIKTIYNLDCRNI
jgi:hypothetical protein